MNEAHPPRAADQEGLHALQKTHKARDESTVEAQSASISESLRSGAREVGPRVLTKEPKHLYIPTSPRAKAALEAEVTDVVREMFNEMSDVGLKPVVVLHNLNPGELYEHVSYYYYYSAWFLLTTPFFEPYAELLTICCNHCLHIIYQLTSLAAQALKYEPSTHIVSSGALATLSGARTGRSPKDKRVVREPESEADVWWGAGSPNIEMDERTFLLNRERGVDYLNMLDRIYVFDGFAGWDPEARYKIRVVCGRPYHALFMNNMLIRPTEEELANFGQPDFTIYNAGAFPANRYTSFMTSSTSVRQTIFCMRFDVELYSIILWVNAFFGSFSSLAIFFFLLFRWM
jgi:phosphoenolpyruvate carboxykinase (ATP)